ncbi:cytochrome-c peroxidase [Adhaeribacter aquaticus]|uniref:cytochrome-c peroxidase n=1 Tax=Adhaeribacter aquaticus TaxID=299567 RepID=UPI000684D911|nr:cytochrome c peroxidase [Adhaeribacter aquaticus]
MHNNKLAKNLNINLKLLLLVLSVGLFSVVFLTSFIAEPESKIPVIVKSKFVQDIDLLKQQAHQLTLALELLQKNKLTQSQIQDNFHRVKATYKQVEYLLEYLDPELTKSINGPPLPKVLIEDANYLALGFQKPSVRTFPPQGLQVLEELLFSETIAPEQLKNGLVLAYSLKEKILLFSNNLYNQPITTKQLLESMREQLVRAMTMGITGFDAPAAGKEIAYTAIALQPVLSATELYSNTNRSQSENFGLQAAQQLKVAITYLNQHPDFDAFDRIYFIRELLDPAYASLTRLQQQVAPESINQLLKPVNDKAISLFSLDFLLTNYYAKQDRQAHNPALTDLGKTLFFDPLLSSNNNRSCASCHAPAKAFTDNVPLSVAFDFAGTVKRNAPTLLNTIFSTAYFWDSRAQYLQDQIPSVVVKTDELHGNYEDIVKKLNQSPAYKNTFKLAFADQADYSINANTINRAIAAYLQSLVALNSPFDQYMRHETADLPAATKRGFNLFMGKAGCGTCHFAPIFNGTVPPRFLESESEVLGVTATSDFANPILDTDIGKAGNIPADVYQYSFKTPTVRNVAATAPYMHNGTFATLLEVVEFYDRGGGAGMGLNVPHQTLPANPLNLSDSEKEDLIAFMQSLTDSTFTTSVPRVLPKLLFNKKLNKRLVGGSY